MATNFLHARQVMAAVEVAVDASIPTRERARPAVRGPAAAADPVPDLARLRWDASLAPQVRSRPAGGNPLIGPAAVIADPGDLQRPVVVRVPGDDPSPGSAAFAAVRAHQAPLAQGFAYGVGGSGG